NGGELIQDLTFACDGIGKHNIERLFFSSRRRHTRFSRDWSSDVCSSDLVRDRRRRLPRVGPARERDRATEQQALARARHGDVQRSEERRVGKEWRTKRAAVNSKKTIDRGRRNWHVEQQA